MSQVRLTLRPPPNVDFVHGYPGIPPGAPDRPQACVKGAVEIRMPPQGVKAKWMRVELRKVETLPGGGPSNKLHDFVGSGPLTLWSSPDEYVLLPRHDWPFILRIPESIPPTVALEDSAGIHYELVASICTKGKRSWFRKAKPVVVSTEAQIMIDKHELHSTWPIYCQPEERKQIQDGVTLTVNRNNNCFGPGDRISVLVSVKSDNVAAIALRGFEIVLQESIAFRHGPFAFGIKKATAREKKISSIVCDGKLGLTTMLYGGTQHQAELVCVVPPNHTTTSLNSARYIDITYRLLVRALMGSSVPKVIAIELPVIISNWQRHVSVEAIRRIGTTPNLSLLAQSAARPGVAADSSNGAHRAPVFSMPSARSAPRSEEANELGFSRNPSFQAFNTIPQGSATPSTIVSKLPEEKGYAHGSKQGYPNKDNAPASHLSAEQAPARANTLATSSSSSHANVPTRRTESARAVGNTGRLAIVNPQLPETSEAHPASRHLSANAPGRNQFPSTTTSTSQHSERPWKTAEEEKLDLYEKTRAQVVKLQGATSDVESLQPTSNNAARSKSPQPRMTTSPRPSQRPQWPTAEEEKQRLYNEARAAVDRTQNLASNSPPASLHTSGGSGMNGIQTSGGQGSNAAELYKHALLQMSDAGMRNAATRTSPAIPVVQTPPPIPQYMSAEDEKKALQRYHAARNAVERTQNQVFGSDEEEEEGTSTARSAPIAYESLYPNRFQHPQRLQESPPPFDVASGIPAAHLSEKERMRRAYEAQDAAGRLAAAPVSVPSPPPFSGRDVYTDATIEKEIARRRMEERDAAFAARTQIPRNSSFAGTGRPTPPPPRSTSSPKYLTAAEEKSLLRAQMGEPRVLSAAEEKAQLQAKFDKLDNGVQALERPQYQAPTLPINHAAQMLTAVQEKEMLRARYAMEDSNAQPTQQAQAQAHANGYLRSHTRAGSSMEGTTLPPAISVPPTLPPKPPAHYIKETQEEDERVSRLAMSGELPPLEDDAPSFLERMHTVRMNSNAVSQHRNLASPTSPSLSPSPSVRAPGAAVPLLPFSAD